MGATFAGVGEPRTVIIYTYVYVYMYIYIYIYIGYHRVLELGLSG